MKKIILFGVVFTMSLLAQAGVWIEENQWSPEWEQKYREWVRTNSGAKFFSAEKKANGEDNPYYGIRVDCADLVYSHRIIFSYENKLPFAMTNPVNERGALITNQIKRFDSTTEGVPRLKRFLIWVYDMLSTHSMPLDTYSPAFKDIGPGNIILTSRKNHHSWTIKSISRTGNPTLVFNSTVGRESGFDVQERQSWPNPYWIFEPEVDKDDETKNINIYQPGSYAGFRYWRPLEFLKQPETMIPEYSDEQHTIGISKWKATAQMTLAKVKESLDQVVMRLLKDACADFTQRVAAVNEAELYKSNLAADLASGKSAEQSDYVRELMSDSTKPSDLRCMTYKAFDQFSTPSRDRRLVDSLMLARAYYSYGMSKLGVKVFSAQNLKLYKIIFPFISESAESEAAKDSVAKISNFCSLNVGSSLGNLSLAEYKRRVFLGKYSSNPNDSTAVRFGYSKTSKDLGDSCPAYDFTQGVYNFEQSEQEMMREVLSSPQVL